MNTVCYFMIIHKSVQIGMSKINAFITYTPNSKYPLLILEGVPKKVDKYFLFSFSLILSAIRFLIIFWQDFSTCLQNFGFQMIKHLNHCFHIEFPATFSIFIFFNVSPKVFDPQRRQNTSK